MSTFSIASAGRCTDRLRLPRLETAGVEQRRAQQQPLIGGWPVQPARPEIGARAGAHSPVSACASGAEAIGYGIDMIRSGRADVVLAGGTEAAIMPLNIGAFAVMRAMSTRNDDPERASRPFDKARDGFVLGEGAGMLVLESLSHARERGAVVYAIAAGAGYSSDAYHIAHPAPDGAGVTSAIRRALADARVDPTQIVHVNAHATSTPEGDALEAQALVKALGSAVEGVIVTSTLCVTALVRSRCSCTSRVASCCSRQS